MDPELALAASLRAGEDELLARVQHGDLTQADLRLLAYLGDEPAQTALGSRAPQVPRELEDWAQGLAEWGKPAVARALAAALREALERGSDDAGGAAARRVLTRLDAWIASEAKPELQALSAACAEVPAVEGRSWPAVVRSLAGSCAAPLSAWRLGPATRQAFAAAVEAAGRGFGRRPEVGGALRRSASAALRGWATRSRLLLAAEARWSERPDAAALLTLLRARQRLDQLETGALVFAARAASSGALTLLDEREAEEARAGNPWYLDPWPADPAHVQGCVERLRGQSALLAVRATLEWAAAALGASPVPDVEVSQITDAWVAALVLPPALDPVRALASDCVRAATCEQPRGATVDFEEHRYAARVAVAALEACGGDAAGLLRAIQRAVLERWLRVTLPEGWEPRASTQ